MIFGSVWATARVGRVSPRPPDRGRNCTLLGREPLREEKAFGLMGRWVAGDPAVSERRALPARSPDRQRVLGVSVHPATLFQTREFFP